MNPSPSPPPPSPPSPPPIIPPKSPPPRSSTPPRNKEKHQRPDRRHHRPTVPRPSVPPSPVGRQSNPHTASPPSHPPKPPSGGFKTRRHIHSRRFRPTPGIVPAEHIVLHSGTMLRWHGTLGPVLCCASRRCCWVRCAVVWCAMGSGLCCILPGRSDKRSTAALDVFWREVFEMHLEVRSSRRLSWNSRISVLSDI